MNNQQLVSVLIPTLNSERTIERCLNSVFEQDYKNLEVMICDGGSTDNTKKIIKAKFLKAILIESEKGVSKQRNILINNCSGDFVFFLDSDDFLEPTFFTKLMDAQSINSADIVAPSYVYFDDKKESKKIIDCNEILNYFNYFELSDNHNLYLAPHKLFSKKFIGDNRFNEKLSYGEDLNFIFELANKNGKYVGIPDAFYYFYHNPKSYIKKYDVKKRLLIHSVLFDKRKLFKKNKNLLERYNKWLYIKIVDFINYLLRNKKILSLLRLLRIRYYLIFNCKNVKKSILLFPLIYAIIRKSKNA